MKFWCMYYGRFVSYADIDNKLAVVSVNHGGNDPLPDVYHVTCQERHDMEVFSGQ